MAVGIGPSKCDFCDFFTYHPCTFVQSAGCSNRIATQEAKQMNPKQDQQAHGVKEVFNTPRSRLLDEVMQIVHKDRNANYGNPEDNFGQIAALWNCYYQGHGRPAVKFTPADVAIMNMLIKVARLSKSPTHHDSAVDIAGYAACLADIQESVLKNTVGSPSA